MKVSFYYWGWQCPLHGTMRQLLDSYRDRLDISCTDITGQPQLARDLNLFFPMLTVVNGRRYFSPLRPAFLDALCLGALPEEQPYRPHLGTRVETGQLEPITKDNIALAAQCTGDPGCSGCREKAAWLAAQGVELFGFVNRRESRLLGGAEYLPSVLVPYDIPKAPDIAFLTCVHGSDPTADYKSGPLAALENFLRRDYRRIVVISDELGVFPNGNLDFFLRNHYRDMGLVREEPGYCRLHLMEKAV